MSVYGEPVVVDERESDEASKLKRWETPAVYTSTTPAWSNVNLTRLSDKIRSSLVFAHVRAASVGSPVTELNCHPFSAGRYLFMHNGALAGFEILRRQMIMLMSESAFSAVKVRFVRQTGNAHTSQVLISFPFLPPLVFTLPVSNSTGHL